MPRVKTIKRKKPRASRTNSRNVNAHARRSRPNRSDVVADLETIGQMIIADLQEYNRQQIPAATETLPLGVRRRTLEEIFDDFRTLDDHDRRGLSRSIGAGDVPKPTQRSRRKASVLSATPVPRTMRTRSSTMSTVNNHNRLAEPAAGSGPKFDA